MTFGELDFLQLVGGNISLHLEWEKSKGFHQSRRQPIAASECNQLPCNEESQPQPWESAEEYIVPKEAASSYGLQSLKAS